MYVNIGFGNFVNSSQIIAINRIDSAPMRRMVQQAKDSDAIIDATQGRKTKSVIVTCGGHIILSALLPDTVAERCGRVSIEGSDNEG